MMKVLAKCLNFAGAPWEVPVKARVGVEVTLKDFSETDVETIRGVVSGILQTTQPMTIDQKRREMP